jgi:hypothetical protein
MANENLQETRALMNLFIEMLQTAYAYGRYDALNELIRTEGKGEDERGFIEWRKNATQTFFECLKILKKEA